ALYALRYAKSDFTLLDLATFGSIHATFGHIDRWMEIESGNLTDDEAEAMRPDFYAAFFGNRGEPTPSKVHDAWGRTRSGRPLFDASFTHATIYIVRDPRDVAVSWSNFFGYSIDKAIDILSDPNAALAVDKARRSTQLRQKLGTWSQHVVSWVDESGLSPLVIRYEDMLTDPALAFRSVCDTIGWERDEAAIESAIASTSFGHLAAQERKYGFGEVADRTERFFRSGKAGGWRDLLTGAQAARIESDHGEVMRRFGYF
ncbi:MAG: sulfotransferase domain-containing protein, partial [Sphingomonas sp.]